MSPWGFIVLFSLLLCIFENFHCEPLEKEKKQQRAKASLHIAGAKDNWDSSIPRVPAWGHWPLSLSLEPHSVDWTTSGAAPPPSNSCYCSQSLSWLSALRLASPARLRHWGLCCRGQLRLSKDGRQILPDPKYPANLLTTDGSSLQLLPLLSRIVSPKSWY